MSDDEADLWPVLPSGIVEDTLSDLDVSPKLFSLVAALIVAICENPWLEGSNRMENDPDWREILIPDGHGIAEYRINRVNQQPNTGRSRRRIAWIAQRHVGTCRRAAHTQTKS